MKRIILVTSQIKGNIKDDDWGQQVVRKYHKTYIFMSPKILFLIIYCFKVCVFFIKEVVVLSWIFAPPKEIERSNFYSEHPGIFFTEVDPAGNLSTNIWNIAEFSIT